MSTITVESISPLTRTEAKKLAATEYQRLVDLLRSLEPDDWIRPTECSGWDVRAMAGHCVGMLSDYTSWTAMVKRFVAANRRAKKTGAKFIDALTALQVEQYASVTAVELTAMAAERGPKAAQWRTSAPGLARRISSRQEVGGVLETWRLGYLLDTILTRDPWMHRVDMTRATGRVMVLTSDHDGRLVADVAGEWARRHGQPFTLKLMGPAGGEFVAGDGSGHAITVDAVEFCRILSGRAPGAGLLRQEVPF